MTKMGKVQSEQVEMTIQDALKKYEKLPTQKRCEVLSEAIDYMQQYNGRTKRQWIALVIADEYNAKLKQE